MKLLYCRQCGDVFNLTRTRRECICGGAHGAYQDDGLHADYGGDFAVPVGFSNSSFRDAMDNQPSHGWGRPFNAFVIPRQCETMTKEATHEG